jgi:hypothetical protein
VCGTTWYSVLCVLCVMCSAVCRVMCAAMCFVGYIVYCAVCCATFALLCFVCCIIYYSVLSELTVYRVECSSVLYFVLCAVMQSKSSFDIFVCMALRCLSAVCMCCTPSVQLDCVLFVMSHC